jgi:hypothetical protein
MSNHTTPFRQTEGVVLQREPGDWFTSQPSAHEVQVCGESRCTDAPPSLLGAVVPLKSANSRPFDVCVVVRNGARHDLLTTSTRTRLPTRSYADLHGKQHEYLGSANLYVNAHGALAPVA